MAIRKDDANGFSWDIQDALLGIGAFASVFLVKRKPANGVEDDSLPTVMAVKIAPLAEASTLRLEKDILSFLTPSDFLIKCYGDKETEKHDREKTYNLFLEFCSGGNLYNHVKLSATGLLEHEVRRYTRDILRGLDHIHSHGVVHCDIKPDNILLVPGKDGGFMAKIADFGMAKDLQHDEEISTYLRGTVCYMSPELVKDRLLTYPADIWALGCVVIEMMSPKISAWGSFGHGLASRDDMLELIALSSEVPEFPSNISEDGRDFLSKCFIRDHHIRWTAKQLLEHPFPTVDE